MGHRKSINEKTKGRVSLASSRRICDYTPRTSLNVGTVGTSAMVEGGKRDVEQVQGQVGERENLNVMHCLSKCPKTETPFEFSAPSFAFPRLPPLNCLSLLTLTIHPLSLLFHYFNATYSPNAIHNPRGVAERRHHWSRHPHGSDDSDSIVFCCLTGTLSVFSIAILSFPSSFTASSTLDTPNERRKDRGTRAHPG